MTDRHEVVDPVFVPGGGSVESTVLSSRRVSKLTFNLRATLHRGGSRGRPCYRVLRPHVQGEGGGTTSNAVPKGAGASAGIQVNSN